MHVRDTQRQILFRHVLGPKQGLQDTLSLKRFRLGDREWSATKRQIESILTAQHAEADHMRSTFAWLESIPRKLHAYLLDRLLQYDPQFFTQQSVDLDESIDDFEAYRQTLDTSIATDRQVLRDVSQLRSRCPSNVTRIDESMLSDLLAELADENGYAPNTVNRHAKHWNVFFEWLRNERQVIACNPCARLDKSTSARAKDEIRTEWIDQLVASCKSTEERYWLRLMQWTGCRTNEGLSLRKCDFDLQRKSITFNESKNDRRRVNPIYPAIAQYLPELLHGLDPSELVLRRITRDTCYTWLTELRERVGVPAWQPPYYAFRSTRTNQLASDRSISPQEAGMLLGHSATVARRNYLSVSDTLLERLAVA